MGSDTAGTRRGGRGSSVRDRGGHTDPNGESGPGMGAGLRDTPDGWCCQRGGGSRGPGRDSRHRKVDCRCIHEVLKGCSTRFPDGSSDSAHSTPARTIPLPAPPRSSQQRQALPPASCPLPLTTRMPPLTPQCRTGCGPRRGLGGSLRGVAHDLDLDHPLGSRRRSGLEGPVPAGAGRNGPPHALGPALRSGFLPPPRIWIRPWSRRPRPRAGTC